MCRGKERSLGSSRFWPEIIIIGNKMMTTTATTMMMMMMMATLTCCAPTLCLTLLNPYDYPEKQEVDMGYVVGSWIYLDLFILKAGST